MSRFLPTCGFKWIDPKDFDLSKYNKNSSEGCFLEADIENPKELCKLRNDYPLALDKTEIKEEMLSEYLVFIADFRNISIGNVKKLLANFLDKEKYVLQHENSQLYLRLRLKLKKQIAH